MYHSYTLAYSQGVREKVENNTAEDLQKTTRKNFSTMGFVQKWPENSS